MDILQAAKDKNIVFLQQGSYEFALDNGAAMKLHASPFTPNHGGDWGFQYHDGHGFTMEDGTDIVITHGPPRGIMDMTAEKTRVGCPLLFEAVARAQPKVHCFGHVHGGWGAKFVKWRAPLTEKPSHFTDIDNGESCVVSSLAKMTAGGGRREGGGGCYKETSHCTGDEFPLRTGTTLFVNAAGKGQEGLSQMPWVVDLELQANSK